MNYPIHLGVTEAGDAEDERIKSANGIGALLADGIGDTIRVSLTENPEFELPVARKIVDFYNSKPNLKDEETNSVNFPINPYQYTRRTSLAIDNMGASHPVIIIGNDTNRKADYSFTKNKIENNLTNEKFDLCNDDKRFDDISKPIFFQMSSVISIDFNNIDLVNSIKSDKNLNILPSSELVNCAPCE